MKNIKKNFGFGFMRLPMIGEEVDYDHTIKMVDAFLEAGFNYFDTAHGYIDGKSEIALKHCLTSRYPRESYVLTNKLSPNFFEKQEDIRPLLELQLQACGVDYFDFYLMHAQNKDLFAKYKACRAYETALELKAEGKIRHMGISFHDKAVVLDQILTEYPQIEVAQIQLNYVDMDDPIVESRKCLEVCRKHKVPAIIMEPVKGGKLVNLPKLAANVLDELGGGSHASYAIRFAAGQEGVFMTLSGMGSLEMVLDNVGYMQDFKPLDEKEQTAIEKVRRIFASIDTIECTDCRYCMEVCPRKIPAPKFFAMMNNKKVWGSWNKEYAAKLMAEPGQGPDDCLGCGDCEAACPQHLPIRRLLKTVDETLR